MKKTLFVVLVSVMLLLTACKTNGMFSSDATQSPALAIATETPTPTAVTCVDNTPQATPTIMSTPMDAVAATPTVSGNCLGKLSGDTSMAFTVVSNMDVGDGSLISLTLAQDATGAAFVALIEPGYNLDFESAMISGKFIQTKADLITAVCAGNEMATNAGNVYRLYVGNANTPEGWSKDFPSGWKMSITAYDNVQIDVPGAVWIPTNVALTDASHIYGNANDWTYVQLWDGNDSTKPLHIIIEPGATIATKPLQGTAWVITNVNDSNVALAIARFLQMTDEVLHRDDRPTITTIYVGAQTPPTGWETTLPADWQPPVTQ